MGQRVSSRTEGSGGLKGCQHGSVASRMPRGTGAVSPQPTRARSRHVPLDLSDPRRWEGLSRAQPGLRTFSEPWARACAWPVRCGRRGSCDRPARPLPLDQPRPGRARQPGPIRRPHPGQPERLRWTPAPVASGARDSRARSASWPTCLFSSAPCWAAQDAWELRIQQTRSAHLPSGQAPTGSGNQMPKAASPGSPIPSARTAAARERDRGTKT